MKFFVFGLIILNLNFAMGKTNFLEKYKGKEEIPQQLYQTYKNLMKAFEKQNIKLIQKYCLSGSIGFVSKERSSEKIHYGTDISLPFLKKYFQSDILFVRKDSKDTYLLRTDTTAFWFVKTDKTGWKLYKYLDKPIQ